MGYALTVIVFICVNIVAATGLSLLTGFTGLFSLGHAGFMAIGGYTSAIMAMHLGIPYVPAVILGGAAAVIISVVIGYPSIKNRLRGDYFAICMLGFVEIVRLVISNITHPWVNGSLGLTGIPKLTNVWTALIICIIMVFFMRNFIKSHYGQNCKAIQQQDVAAEMMGISIVKTRLISLMISAFYCGVAGSVMTFYTAFISPLSFQAPQSQNLVADVVIGGVNSITGPIIAAAILTALPEMLRFLISWRYVIYGLLLVVLIIFRPEGIMGYKEFSIGGFIGFFKKTYRVAVRLFKKLFGKNSKTADKKGGKV